MLEAIGITAVAVTVAIITFCLSIRIMDYLRWWNEAGLAAFIPMLAIAIPLSLLTASVAVWILKLTIH